MKYLLILTIGFLVVLFGSSPANAATECYGIGGSTHELSLSTQSRFGQQFTPDGTTTISEVAVNIWVPTFSPTPTGFFHFQIHETTAGIPNSTIVAGSQVQIAVGDVPVRGVGTPQAFICGSIPTFQKFVFASPIALNSGQVYAFAIHRTTGDGGVVGYVKDFPLIAPQSGLTCTGAPCVSHTGWALSDHGGVNFDMIYSLENDLIEGSVRTGKIDGHVAEFREFLQLDNESGGFIFVMGFIALLFLLMLSINVPFIPLSMLAVLVIGIFTGLGIMPAWILLSVTGIAGFAMVLKIFGSRRGDSSE